MIRKTLMMLFALCLLMSFSGVTEESKSYEKLIEENRDTLTEENAIAFLEIPSIGLLLPVMQHPQDDGFYLKHNALGEESAQGALYTEKTYNEKDFSDPVTVIYGRRMDDQTMFGALQQLYSSSFDDAKDIYLYLPGEVRHYTAFAAVPFSNIHIMYSYNFRHSRMREAFFDEVFATRRPGVQLDDGLRPESGDKVIILSTGLKGDATQRYLVIAKINRTEIN